MDTGVKESSTLKALTRDAFRSCVYTVGEQGGIVGGTLQRCRCKGNRMQTAIAHNHQSFALQWFQRHGQNQLH